MSANVYIKSIELKSNGRTWDVWVNGRIVEGGFFSKGPALAARDWWQRNYREEEAAQS